MTAITRERNVGSDAVTIAGGQKNSTAFKTGGRAWGRLTFPAAISGTTYHMETSEDGSAFVLAYDDSGTQMTFTPTANTSHRIPDGAFPAEFMRVVSDTNEAANREVIYKVCG